MKCVADRLNLPCCFSLGFTDVSDEHLSWSDTNLLKLFQKCWADTA